MSRQLTILNKFSKSSELKIKYYGRRAEGEKEKRNLSPIRFLNWVLKNA